MVSMRSCLSFCYGSLFLFIVTDAEEIDPLSELDVMRRYRMINHRQCQRLCWYWHACGRYSFYTKNDNSWVNCVLHGSSHSAENLKDGWFDEEAAPNDMDRTDGCAGRPCLQREMCLPVHASPNFLCTPANSDAWLGQRCPGACQSPPSAGQTECVHGQCLCAAGHFYSESRRTCLPACRQLGNSYLDYKLHDLRGYDQYSVKTTGIAECKRRCNSDPKCVMFVYGYVKEKCFFKYVTALDYPARWRPNAVADAYQRTCA